MSQDIAKKTAQSILALLRGPDKAQAVGEDQLMVLVECEVLDAIQQVMDERRAPRYSVMDKEREVGLLTIEIAEEKRKHRIELDALREHGERRAKPRTPR